MYRDRSTLERELLAGRWELHNAELDIDIAQVPPLSARCSRHVQ